MADPDSVHTMPAKEMSLTLATSPSAVAFAAEDPTFTKHADHDGDPPTTPTTSGGFALTEYSANPSPPPKDGPSNMSRVVPAAFLLPNGYPDVRVVVPT